MKIPSINIFLFSDCIHIDVTVQNYRNAQSYSTKLHWFLTKPALLHCIPHNLTILHQVTIEMLVVPAEDQHLTVQFNHESKFKL